MADKNTIARPYAQAIFDVARETGSLDDVSVSLATGKSLLHDGQVGGFLSTPTLNDEERLTFLQGLFSSAAGKDSGFAGGDRHGTNFLKVLLEYKRVDVLPEISEHFERLKADIENVVDVVVTSATALSDDQIKQISSALNKRLGRNISI